MFKAFVTMPSSAILAVALGLATLYPIASASEPGVHQPIFLLCPHTLRFDSWSLFFTVDADDHSKVLSLGLERLIKQNSKESSYRKVIAAQYSPGTKRETITTLAAKDFATLQLTIDKDKALQVSLTRQPDGSMELMISMRINLSERFTIGGPEEQAKRALVVHYDPVSSRWITKAKRLNDYMDVAIDDAPGRVMSGIVFPVTETGIYQVLGVWENGDAAILMDRTEKVDHN